MGWSEGANTRAILTLILNKETVNSPKTDHYHTVQKTTNSIIFNHESSQMHKISVWIFSSLLCGMESEIWYLAGHNVRMFFLIYINDLPTIVNKDNMVIFADDTSIIITDSNRKAFNINENQMFQGINTWCNVSLLVLNFNKTQYLEFRTKYYYNVNTQIKYDQEYITNTTKIKFLGLTIDDTLLRKQHIEQVINEMCSACYALRNIKHIAPVDTQRVIYFAHIHSIISYGIIFWGSSYYANKVFILQKKTIRIVTNTRPRVSCREAFKNMEIMTLYSQYIYSLVLHIVNNKHLFDTNNEIHKYLFIHLFNLP